MHSWLLIYGTGALETTNINFAYAFQSKIFFVDIYPVTSKLDCWRNQNGNHLAIYIAHTRIHVYLDVSVSPRSPEQMFPIFSSHSVFVNIPTLRILYLARGLWLYIYVVGG